VIEGGGLDHSNDGPPLFAVPMKSPLATEQPLALDGEAPLEPAPTAASCTQPSETSEARMRRVFDENLEIVWRVLRRLGVAPAHADDAAQRVFIVLARRLGDVEPGSERSFLLSTAARVASEVRRHTTRNREVNGQHARLNLEVDAQPLPDEIAERRRAGKLLDWVLEGMTENLRTVLVLYEFESLTVPEISELLQVPLGTAASRLRRARAEFKERVAELDARRRVRGGKP
jgi:RNA polymerase sigma-70 factor, ECF subfamily